jgi:hypothetical protein
VEELGEEGPEGESGCKESISEGDVLVVDVVLELFWGENGCEGGGERE